MNSDATDVRVNITQNGTLPSFSVSPGSLTFNFHINSIAGKQDITVAGNVPWTVTAQPAWVAVTAGSGNGNGTIGVYPTSANNTSTPRSGTLTIRNDITMATTNITITQKKTADMVILEGPTYVIHPYWGLEYHKIVVAVPPGVTLVNEWTVSNAPEEAATNPQQPPWYWNGNWTIWEKWIMAQTLSSGGMTFSNGSTIEKCQLQYPNRFWWRAYGNDDLNTWGYLPNSFDWSSGSPDKIGVNILDLRP
jgi:hypothetical protein